MLTHGPVHLLVAILNSPDDVDAILAGFVSSWGYGARRLSTRRGWDACSPTTSPSLRGCKRFSIGPGPENRAVLTVISADLIDPVISLIQESCGDLEKPANGDTP